IFHARPEDVDASRLRHHLERRLDLDDAHKLFLKEMLDVLEDGKSPADLEEREWISSLEPTVALLLRRLSGAAKAYETTSSASRMALIARLMNLKEMAALQETSKSLKSELARVSATPGSEDEQRRILFEIVQIER